MRLEGGEVSAVRAVRACLDRVAAGNEELRAFIRVRESEAESEAAEADLAKAAGTDAGALWGVPVAVKDLMDVGGMRTTAASRVLQGEAEAAGDAECVRRLRAAGAIVLGKTNLHEFAYGGSGAISAYGAVRNPLDPSRVCGGSSSGSAAAVAAGMCFGALGTDTAGSIRLPAACCGVVGFKPTWGTNSGDGSDSAGVVVRPRGAAGAVGGRRCHAVPGAGGRGGRARQGWRRVTRLRCGVARKYFCDGLAPEVESGFKRALAAAHGLGWSLHEVEIEVSEDRRVSNAESWAFHEKWVGERASLYDPRTMARIVNGRNQPLEEYVEARRALELMRERQREGVAGVDVVLTPTSPLLPPALEEFDGPQARALELKMLRNTRPFNVLGWPAVTVPCAPMVGVQVSAGWGQDWVALTAARAMERAMRGLGERNLPKNGEK